MWTMPERDTDFAFEKKTKSLRFTDAERALLRALMRRVRGRSQLAKKAANPSNLIKEMMGIAQMGLLTEEDRRWVASEVARVDFSVIPAKLDTENKGRSGNRRSG